MNNIRATIVVLLLFMTNSSYGGGDVDYLGNETTYYNELLMSFKEKLKNNLTPITTDQVKSIKGEWKLEGYNFENHDTLEFDGIEAVTKSSEYQFYKIPEQGILSLWSHYDAIPEYGVTEGYEENAFYAHWLNDNTIHLSNPDSSLQWLLTKQP